MSVSEKFGETLQDTTHYCNLPAELILYFTGLDRIGGIVTDDRGKLC